MENTFNIFDFLKQMLVVIPAIISATLLFTELIKDIVKIKVELPKWAKILISQVIAIATACAFVATGKFTFGLGNWDYAIGVVFGILAGLAASGLYSWPAVEKLIKAIIEIFCNAVAKIFTKKE